MKPLRWFQLNNCLGPNESKKIITSLLKFVFKFNIDKNNSELQNVFFFFFPLLLIISWPYQLYLVPLWRFCVKSDNCPDSALAASDDCSLWSDVVTLAATSITLRNPRSNFWKLRWIVGNAGAETRKSLVLLHERDQCSLTCSGLFPRGFIGIHVVDPLLSKAQKPSWTEYLRCCFLTTDTKRRTLC